jgi:hypothetical protein
MIEESLYKSNFIGRDGFRWWIGNVAPFEGGQADQHNGGGWGNRTKVRILGYHPFDEETLSNEDLPWAQVLLPTTSGSGAGNVAENTKLRPSDSVFGFFLDGDNAQLPVIIGVFGRTSEVSQEQYTFPFVPFTGYTGRIEKPDASLLAPNESNENNTQTQKSPRDAPSEVIQSLNQNIDELNSSLPPNTPQFWKEAASYTGIGKKVVLANTCEDTAISSIIATVNNLFDAVTGLGGSFLNVGLEISKSVRAITAAANSIVSSMFTRLSETLIPLLQEGLGNLFNEVVSKFTDFAEGVLAGVDAQLGFLSPIGELQNALFCGIGNVVNGLGSMIESLLNSTLENAKNFVSCIGTQVVGSLINFITSKIEGFLGPTLGAVSKLLGDGFDLFNTITSGIDAISSIASIFDCNQSNSKCDGIVKEYTIGKGVIDYVKDTSAILENAKISNQIGNIAVAIGTDINKKLSEIGLLGEGRESGLPNCDTNLSFSLPEIRIFGGGGGSGASASPIMGEFVKNKSGRITASVVGVKINDPGSGYKYPPFVEVVDPSREGIGAIPRALLNNDGTLRSIYMVSIGENYPIGELAIDGTRVPTTGPGGFPLDPDTLNQLSLRNLPRNISVGVGSTMNIGIASIVVVNPGSGYISTDLITDEFGTPYNSSGTEEPITYGDVLERQPTLLFTNYPEIRVLSSTGTGAILKAQVGIVSSVDKLTQIIDCI